MRNKHLSMVAGVLACGLAGATAWGGPQQAGSTEQELAELRSEVQQLRSELRQQQARGSGFFFGEELTALDLYWAAFSNMIQPLDPADCPLSEASRAAYANLPDAVAAAADPILYQHRDRVWRDVIGLPMDF